MRTRVEDLLSIRDREPLEAGVRERIAGDDSARTELLRLERMRDELRSLPELEAPSGAWARIRAELSAPPAVTRRRILPAAAAAAVLGVLVVGALSLTSNVEEPPRVAVVADTVPPGGAPADARAVDADYRTLIDRSAELERLLMRLPERQHRIQLGTASTIVGLEERIALIDAQLSVAAADGYGAQVHKALWTERVDLMNALLHVRYAYTQTVAF